MLDVCEYLETKGAEITYLDVEQNGLINLDELKNIIKENTILVCIMYANNETGVIQDIEKIGKITKKKMFFFSVMLRKQLVKFLLMLKRQHHILTLSSHKMYGPKGVGGVYINRRYPKIKLGSLIHGGGHERATDLEH